MEYRGIRYRLYPKTKQKAEMLHQCLGATRYVWNHFLARNRQIMEAHRNDESLPRPSVSFFSLGKEFVQLTRIFHKFAGMAAFSVSMEYFSS